MFESTLLGEIGGPGLDFGGVSHSNEGSHNGSPMAAVSSDQSVGGDGRGEVIVILPGEVERGGKRLIDVTGGAENFSDDHPVRTLFPFGGFFCGEPITGRVHESVPDAESVFQIK